MNLQILRIYLVHVSHLYLYLKIYVIKIVGRYLIVFLYKHFHLFNVHVAIVIKHLKKVLFNSL